MENTEFEDDFAEGKHLEVTFKKFEKRTAGNFPKIKTIKNRQYHTEKVRVFGKNSKTILKKDFTTFSQNKQKNKSKLNQLKKIPVYNGFNPELKTFHVDAQTQDHEHFFRLKQLKSTFVTFSKDNFFFTLNGQSKSQDSLEVTNKSDFYHFRIIFLIKSKEFKVDLQEIQLSPLERKTVVLTFSPLQKTLFHHSKLDVVITNEKINHLSYNDVRNHKLRIQKKQITNCFLGDIK